MQRIDAHQHFWVFDPVRDQWITENMSQIRRDFLPGDLAPLLKENKVGGCIAVQASQTRKETAFLLQLAAKNSFIKAVIGWVDLKDPALTQLLEQYQDSSLLKGFRHVLQDEPDLEQFLEDGTFEKGVEKVLSAGYCYELLVFHHQLALITPMAERLSENENNKLVLDHIGKPDLKTGQIQQWQSSIRTLGANKNLYCKVSGLVTEADWNNWRLDDLRVALDTVVDVFGPERLMFGSDWPVCLLATSYTKWLEMLETYFAGFTAGEQEAIFGGNAARFYGVE